MNRALCYLRLSNWASVVDDCKQAIQLDPTSIKAHFFMGQALAEIGNYDEALVVQHKGTPSYQHEGTLSYVVAFSHWEHAYG